MIDVLVAVGEAVGIGGIEITRYGITFVTAK